MDIILYLYPVAQEGLDELTDIFRIKDEFNRKPIDWLLWYNTERSHRSLNLEPPVDYLIKNNFISNMCRTNTVYRHKPYRLIYLGDSLVQKRQRKQLNPYAKKI